MIKEVYILEWFGPFSTPKDVLYWERENIGNGKTFLYLIKGKKPSKHMFSYYCGQAYKQSAGERMMNKEHHINEVLNRPNDLQIWVAKFRNMKHPTKVDVNIVEKLITSTMSQIEIADEKSILNQTNKLRPKSHIYLINEWLKPDGTPREKYPAGSIACLVHDVLICYPDKETSHLWGNKRIQYINDLK